MNAHQYAKLRSQYPLVQAVERYLSSLDRKEKYIAMEIFAAIKEEREIRLGFGTQETLERAKVIHAEITKLWNGGVC